LAPEAQASDSRLAEVQPESQLGFGHLLPHSLGVTALQRRDYPARHMVPLGTLNHSPADCTCRELIDDDRPLALRPVHSALRHQVPPGTNPWLRLTRTP
jgi:hypothetical protein